MLRIRTDQIDALRKPALDDFIDDMMLHVHEFFPDECMKLGLESVRGRIVEGIEKADGYGVTSPRGVCKYINLMMTFGPDFDTNPRTTSWAQPILKDTTVPDPTARMDVLSEKALSVLEQAEDPDIESAEDEGGTRSP
jgi:hypothetical protein